ncbi:MAG: hypothetical protein WAL63_03410 [Solirubrobacteraceae bacterium]
MTTTSSTTPSTWLLWFGVLGGAGAWVIQFAANLYFTFAQCNQPTQRWNLPIHGWQVGLSLLALAVGTASTLVSLRIFRSTYEIDDADAQELRGDGTAPPLGRVHFLALVGLTVNFLALAIIVMTGIGAPLLPVCQQS